MTKTGGLRIGLMVPMIGDIPANWSVVERFAREAESAGFDALWVIDDPFHRPHEPTYRAPEAAGRPDNPTVDPLPVLSCIPTLGALAAITTSIDIGSLVANVHFRSPAMLAKDADNLAIISDGRFILGLGAGDDYYQHHALGAIWKKRFSAYEESVEIITTLLRTGKVDFVGEHYSARNVVLAPRGPQPRWPKILVGGWGPRMIRVAAQRADIWNGFFYAGYSGLEDHLPKVLANLDAACEKAGRDPASLERTVSIAAGFDDQPARLGSFVVEGALRGDDTQIAEALLQLSTHGISEVQVLTYPADLRGLERLTKVLSIMRG